MSNKLATEARVGMSFEEKSVWLQLAGMGLALGGYFAIAGVMRVRGIDALPAYVPLFAGAVVVMVVILVAGHILAALTARPEPADERDRLIAWRAEARSGWVVAVGVLTGITGLVFGVDDVIVAHTLLGGLFCSEVLGFVLRIISYRRGA